MYVCCQFSEYLASTAVTTDRASETLDLPLGVTCTLIATLSSGLAGVYFEYVIKGEFCSASVVLACSAARRGEAQCMGAQLSAGRVLGADWTGGVVLAAR